MFHPLCVCERSFTCSVILRDAVAERQKESTTTSRLWWIINDDITRLADEIYVALLLRGGEQLPVNEIFITMEKYFHYYPWLSSSFRLLVTSKKASAQHDEPEHQQCWERQKIHDYFSFIFGHHQNIIERVECWFRAKNGDFINSTGSPSSQARNNRLK